jgi:hypothetical protein
MHSTFLVTETPNPSGDVAGLPGPDRTDLAWQFFRSPWGPHGVELQAVLNRMRAAPAAGKLVVLAEEPHRAWRLARLPSHRGDALDILPGPPFRSLADVERAAFRLRWEAMTGSPLPEFSLRD